MEKRPVTVYALELRSYEPPLAAIYVHCSKGTYIRSLTRDIALAAGSRGHLRALTRTGVADFRLSQALEVSSLSQEKELLYQALKPPSPEIFKVLGIPVVFTDTSSAEKIVRGLPLAGLLREKRIIPPDDPRIAAAGLFRSGDSALEDGGFLGMIEQKAHGVWSYGYVYART
jgi:tRNA pseudouridine55 synthase